MTQYNYSVEGDYAVTWNYAYRMAFNRAKKNARKVVITDLHSKEYCYVKPDGTVDEWKKAATIHSA